MEKKQLSKSKQFEIVVPVNYSMEASCTRPKKIARIENSLNQSQLTVAKVGSHKAFDDTDSKELFLEKVEPMKVSNHLNCYVCGSFGAKEKLRIRLNPDNPNEAYFSFLNNNEKLAITSKNYVQACSLCFQSLHQQWTFYEIDNKPHFQRIYHMKRIDGKMYVGAEMATQGEYVGQILGLSSENLEPFLEKNIQLESSIFTNNVFKKTQKRNFETIFSMPLEKEQINKNSRKQLIYSNINENIIPESKNNIVCIDKKGENVQDKTDSSKPTDECFPEEKWMSQIDKKIASGASNEYISNLNFKTECDKLHSQQKNISSTYLSDQNCYTSIFRQHGFDTDESDDILDLSMPDKNSAKEVCYVCGVGKQRGTLIELNTARPKIQEEINIPYFPIFDELHPRPAGSRPKNFIGMIQTCEHCHSYLLKQWTRFQIAKTPESRRFYILHSRTICDAEQILLDCSFCGFKTCSSTFKLLYGCTKKNILINFPLLKNNKTLQVCNSENTKEIFRICPYCFENYFKLPNNLIDNFDGTSDNSERCAINKCVEKSLNTINSIENQSSSENRNKKQLQFNKYDEKSKLSADVKRALGNEPVKSVLQQHMCYICQTVCILDEMEWLPTSAEYINSHAMHFPCLQNDSNRSYGCDVNYKRILACKNCVKCLTSQWEAMDAARIPLEFRKYNMPCSVMILNPGNKTTSDKANCKFTDSSSVYGSSSEKTSIYCFLCGLHSDLTFARTLHSQKEGTRPYFPHLLQHEPLPNAEQIRKDKSALVCTFCYHSLINQWHKYEASKTSVNLNDRKYNCHDYICHLCGITTYRKRVRALPVNEFPFVKYQNNCDSLLLENGDYAVVCLDCYESLRQQASQNDRMGVPMSKRAYNWVPQPPPPEDSPDVAVARLPCGERSNQNLISIYSKHNKVNSQRSAEKFKEGNYRQVDDNFQNISSRCKSVIESQMVRSPFTEALKSLAGQIDYKVGSSVNPTICSSSERKSTNINTNNLNSLAITNSCLSDNQKTQKRSVIRSENWKLSKKNEYICSTVNSDGAAKDYFELYKLGDRNENLEMNTNQFSDPIKNASFSCSNQPYKLFYNQKLQHDLCPDYSQSSLPTSTFINPNYTSVAYNRRDGHFGQPSKGYLKLEREMQIDHKEKYANKQKHFGKDDYKTCESFRLNVASLLHNNSNNEYSTLHNNFAKLGDGADTDVCDTNSAFETVNPQTQREKFGLTDATVNAWLPHQSSISTRLQGSYKESLYMHPMTLHENNVDRSSLKYVQKMNSLSHNIPMYLIPPFSLDSLNHYNNFNKFNQNAKETSPEHSYVGTSAINLSTETALNNEIKSVHSNEERAQPN